jgi:trans-aconitate 2-methyltransferase
MLSRGSCGPEGDVGDWNATQYLKFEDERTRPARDLLAQVPPGDYTTIVDLGCGPGNSTELLIDRFPSAPVTGLDRSPDMLRQARERLPQVTFDTADLTSWTPSGQEQLLFANAVLQWVPDREGVIPRLLEGLPRGGVLALQMPDNNDEPSHLAIRDVAASKDWGAALDAAARSRDALLSPAGYYDLLAPLSQRLDIWHAIYNHVLEDAAAIVEWVKGSRLRPCLDALDGDDAREAFVAAYTARIAQLYPPRVDGKVLLRFPRLFIVAVRA